ncbi:MAG: uroporphyrinogen-III synthase [Burkholderiaceae bacterium]|nr:uroporphyrinogen-III synthase [Burkholderiaceae bacterium]
MARQDRAKRVVLTRPADRQEALAKHLRQSGCEVLELPALNIAPIAPSHPSGQSVQPKQSDGQQSSSDPEVANFQPSQFDVLVFVSRAAWQNYQRFYRQSQPTLTHHPILACVGVSTAKQIAVDLNVPLSAITYPKDGLSADSEGLWAVLEPELAPGSKILIVRGQTGRDWLLDTLIQHGMSVTCLSVYRREPAAWSDAQLTTLKQWAGDATAGSSDEQSTGGTGTWLITSAESLAAIEEQYQLHGLTGKPGFAPQKVVVVHERLRNPVRRWLAHWRTGVEGCESVPVLVVAPDDGAIAQGVLGVG